MGDWPFMMGDWPFMMGDWPFMMGDWPFMMGDWPFMMGDRSAMMDNWHSIMGDWPAMMDDQPAMMEDWLGLIALQRDCYKALLPLYDFPEGIEDYCACKIFYLEHPTKDYNPCVQQEAPPDTAQPLWGQHAAPGPLAGLGAVQLEQHVFHQNHRVVESQEEAVGEEPGQDLQSYQEVHAEQPHGPPPPVMPRGELPAASQGDRIPPADLSLRTTALRLASEALATLNASEDERICTAHVPRHNVWPQRIPTASLCPAPEDPTCITTPGPRGSLTTPSPRGSLLHHNSWPQRIPTASQRSSPRGSQLHHNAQPQMIPHNARSQSIHTA
ncbi:uncharacterized protein [Hyperolius riggenbachi]|uniref:uncharacterized protein n=1 Tax=Hyperolius riggenbachi TaxID=752182 RepID=UPI0035A3A30A